MSTPEQPANPPLTRKQLREIRNTGSTPVITPETAAQEAEVPAEPDAPAVQPEHESTDVSPVDDAPAPQPVAHLARPAEPVSVAPAPAADSSVDLGASPLTRRQARQQERIRTASVPVITPEVAAAHAASTGGSAVPVDPRPFAPSEPAPLTTGMHDLFGLAASPARVVTAEAEEEPDQAPGDAISPWAEPGAEGASQADSDEKQKERVVNPLFGAGLLTGEPEQAELPPSFDQLLSRSTGAVSMPNALILSQAPEVAPIAPLSATGEVLITGTLNLPEGLGSTGHVRGTADGKEVDATLVDGELPAHSSPPPIAASAAISTVKTAGEVIKPPAPEKGSRLMLTLAITAGALALALVGVLILAFVTGAL
jgi:hypothetical protein